MLIRHSDYNSMLIPPKTMMTQVGEAERVMTINILWHTMEGVDMLVAAPPSHPTFQLLSYSYSTSHTHNQCCQFNEKRRKFSVQYL